ncbi:hypothetical protein [Ensifer sp. YR511]|uniref:hypothetical protein n=1 Tax=Ensifer sp. YR511 TaxID=1855294 RepID=UPI00088FC13B|nr:hypothetical protein [Ensifer sp. YR511]SDN43360.1 hypothetical protein SAMN05216328_12685 [Ensifer sp. YR511]
MTVALQGVLVLVSFVPIGAANPNKEARFCKRRVRVEHSKQWMFAKESAKRICKGWIGGRAVVRCADELHHLCLRPRHLERADIDEIWIFLADQTEDRDFDALN